MVESWNPEFFINELSIHIKVRLLSWKYLFFSNNILGENVTEEVLHGKPLSLQTTLQLTHRWRYIYIPLSTFKTLWCMIRLLYSTLIFSLCSQASLLKAQVGNMTHVVQSFQPLCYSNEQLLCVHAQLDSPNSNSPPSNELAHCGVELILQRQTLMGWFVETWLGKIKAMGNTSESL